MNSYLYFLKQRISGHQEKQVSIILVRCITMNVLLTALPILVEGYCDLDLSESLLLGLSL